MEDFIHEFYGYWQTPSKCRVKIFSDDGENFVCFEDIGIGTSVTNASEQLAGEIVNKMNFNPHDTRFFETYFREPLRGDTKPYYDTFDEIEYTWVFNEGKWIAKSPRWNPASQEIKKSFINT